MWKNASGLWVMYSVSCISRYFEIKKKNIYVLKLICITVSCGNLLELTAKTERFLLAFLTNVIVLYPIWFLTSSHSILFFILSCFFLFHTQFLYCLSSFMIYLYFSWLFMLSKDIDPYLGQRSTWKFSRLWRLSSISLCFTLLMLS